MMSIGPVVFAANDGGALAPPAGWRSWNQFQGAITQTVVETTVHELARPRHLPDGSSASLASLGYNVAGIDDGWQACGRYGPSGYRYHAANGDPVVNLQKFPSLQNLTRLGRAHGIGLGWYGNACGCMQGCCSDHCDSVECFAGDVNATLAFGFMSYKIDGCGAQRDIALWYELFNHSLRDIKGAPPMLLENCHDGDGEPEGNRPHRDDKGELVCPYHTYRVSSDARPTYGSVLSNLNASISTLDANLSVPGCWAYLDMLELGVTNTQLAGGAKNNCGADREQTCPPLTYLESQTHFGAWSILSSPLTLGFDLSDTAQMGMHLPTISNRDAIEINQDYAGFSGSRFAQSEDLVEFPACGWGASYPGRTNASCAWPRTFSLYKPLSARDPRGSVMAVLLMNNGNDPAALGFEWEDVPGLGRVAGIGDHGCQVYDVWKRSSLGRVSGPRFRAEHVPSHGSCFVTLSGCGREADNTVHMDR
jgi:alpha-galactosidase